MCKVCFLLNIVIKAFPKDRKFQCLKYSEVGFLAGLLAGFSGSLGAVTNRGCYLLPSTVHDILMQQPSTLQDDQGLKLC